MMQPRPPDPIPTRTPQTPKTMNEPSKPAIKSKTHWGILITILGGLFTAIGLEPDLLNFVSDGIQWYDATSIAALLGAITAFVGRQKATKQIKGIFRAK